MTGLVNTASDGDLDSPPQLGDPEAGIAASEGPAEPPLELEPWRNEVAARLARYRARRKPRAPRYPSLLLPFDSGENWSRTSATAAQPTTTATLSSTHFSFDREPEAEAEHISSSSASDQPGSAAYQPGPPQIASSNPAPETSAKILEFPRSAAIPSFHTSTLADPIFDRPRIVEAPEVVPAPPALGGILMEPAPALPAESRAAFRIQSVSISRRLLATAVDALILFASLSAFAAVFLRFNPVRGPLPLLAGVAGTLSVALWFVYQYLFVVHTGSTPGLRAARLKLVKFDGSPVTRSLRRWRVLASLLCGLSAGLGYLWCFLDSDSLCWHDRITRTHLRAR
jgi:uncharacterized RDD family membrane protein YckC